MNFGMREPIKEWYQKEYPSDELGEEMSPTATWQGLFDCLDYKGDVYAFLGVGDSIVRERVFERLALLIDADYDYVYNQWLLGAGC